MANPGVKVTVDYNTGYYDILSFYNGKLLLLRKPIINFGEEKAFKHNYSKKLIKKRREQMIRDLADNVGNDSRYTFSKKMIDQVDPLMYVALKEWDNMAGSTYALDYLKTMTQYYSKYRFTKISTRDFQKICQGIREQKLHNNGIDIEYNVGIFKAHKSLSIIDKIKGIIIANRQKKIIGAKVKSNFTVKQANNMQDRYDIETVESITMGSVKKEFLSQTTKTKEEIERSLHRAPLIIEENNDVLESSTTSSSSSKKRKVKTPKVKKSQGNQKKKMSRKKRISNQRNQRKMESSHYKTQMRLNEERIARKRKLEEIAKNKGNTVKSNSISIVPINEAQIVHLKRRIINDEDSIHHKKFKYNKGEIKRIIKRAVTLVAVGATILGIHLDNNVYTNKEMNNEGMISTSQSYTIDLDETLVRAEDLKSDETIVQGKTKQYELVKIEEIETVEENKQEDLNEQNQQTSEEKIKEFKKIAFEKYMKAFIIGGKPQVGDILEDQSYSQNTDGSGNVGYFCNYPNRSIRFINIGNNTVMVEGKSLFELLQEYPDELDYNIAFENADNGGDLGFVTKSKLESIIQSKIETIIKSKIKTSKNLDTDELFR